MGKKASLLSAVAAVAVTSLLAVSVAGAAVVTHVIRQDEAGKTGLPGPQGEPGKDGVSVTSIEKTGTNELIDTYTITYSDGHTSTFVVVNGAQGPQGIQGIKGDNGLAPVVTIGNNGHWYVDGVDTGFSAEGVAGRSVISVTKTDSNGLIDTYTITYSDNTTSTFTITNGANGQAGVTPHVGDNGNWWIGETDTGVAANGVPGENGKSLLVGVGAPTDATAASVGDSYVDVENWHYYVKAENEWVDKGSFKGADGSSLGVSIVSIEKTDTNGLVDTYTITYTSGSPTTFTVVNGAAGQPGNNGYSLLTGDIDPTTEGVNGDSYLNVLSWEFFIKANDVWVSKGTIKGAQGQEGQAPTISVGDNGNWLVNGVDTNTKAQGVSIASITKTDTQGLVDTYTILYTDGNYETFTVTNGANGAAGTNGITPHIGDNGNWYIGETDTGVSASGQDGQTPTVSINDQGYWVINGVATTTKALGQNGNALLVGEGAPSDAQGAIGDSYIDASNWVYYLKTADGWQNKGSFKGTNGNDGAAGVTPHIGDNGNWFIGENDTGVKAQGAAGVTPTISINEQGYWVINGEATTVKAQGDAGEDGRSIVSIAKTSSNELVDTYTITYSSGEPTTFTVTNGAQGIAGNNGYSLLTGNVNPTTEGVDGDSYLNTATWEYFVKENDAWVSKGTIKGAQGDEGQAPVIAINDQGYWTINGVATVVKAVPVSITGVEKVGTEGLVDTYQINYSDGTSYQFSVTNGANGNDGAAGITPTIGNNGNWFIGETDTGVRAEGQSPVITINDQGYWVIDGVATSAKATGEDGVNGVTPHIGANNHWYIGETDTGVTAIGQDGETPTVTINEQFYWVINGVATNVKAVGQDGNDGKSLIVGQGAPDGSTIANVGDSYVDVENWHYYVKAENEWVDKGSFKGADGANGTNGITPHIGDNGNWYIGETDTGVAAAGQDGVTPTVEINAQGYWVINNVVTDVKAQGVDGNDGRSVVSITKTNTEGLVDTYTITYSSGEPTTFTVTNGANGTNGQNGADGYSFLTGSGEPTTQGNNGDTYLDTATYNLYKKANDAWTLVGNIQGAAGNTPAITINAQGYWTVDGVATSVKAVPVSITQIEKTATNGLIDTYTITYSDGTSSTFMVTNGANGTNGNTLLVGSGAPDAGSGQQGDSYVDVTNWTYYYKGSGSWMSQGSFKGADGNDGVSITSIVRTSGNGAAGTTDTYTITYSEGSPTTFTVYNGADGTNGSSFLTGSGAPTTQGSNGDTYLDIATSDIYTKANDTWTKVGNIQGAEGHTPVITINAQGYWTVDGVATSVKATPVSIVSIARTSGDGSAGTTDTYTITYSDNTSSTFTVTNGANGQNGVTPHIGANGNWYVGETDTGVHAQGDAGEDGKSLIVGNAAPDNNTVANVGDSYVDVTTWHYYVKTSEGWQDKGSFQGDDGRSIVSITRTSGDGSAGTTDTYTIAYSSGASTTFQVTNGANGSSFITGSGAPTTQGADGDTYLDLTTYNLYSKSAGLWTLAGNVKGADGNSLLTGNGAPASGLGKNNDSYVNLLNWDFYVKENGAWEQHGNIRAEKEQHTVTFVSDGDEVDSVTVYHGERVDPSDYEKPGCFIICWTLNDVQWYFDRDVVTCDIELVAVWGVGNINIDPNGIITSYSGSGDLVIPEYINGVKVRGIDADAFMNNTGITSITLPDSITEIEELAFYGCTGLKSINIPAGLTEIPESAFDGCTSLVSIDIPNNIETIGINAFCDCTSLRSVTLHNGLETIGGGAFFRCSNLTDITIPNTVTTIEGAAFQESGITSITIPNSVTQVGEGAFSECNSLVTATLSANATYGDMAFYDCNNLETVIIPEGVEVLSDSMFSDCDKLVNVSLPNTLKTISAGAFQDTAITSIIIPDSVTTLGEADYGAFQECNSLTSIVIGSGVTEIPQMFCYGCERLASITFKGNVTSIGYAAFFEAADLTSIEFPASLTYIGEEAFNDCDSLTNVTFLGNNVQTIDEMAFAQCDALQTITLPNGLSELGEGAFDGCTSLATVVIGNGLVELKKLTFSDCSSLVSLTLPTSITTISDDAFKQRYEYMNQTLHIYFSGTVTKAQWGAIIDDPDDQNNFFPLHIIVHCSDGNYEYNGE